MLDSSNFFGIIKEKADKSSPMLDVLVSKKDIAYPINIRIITFLSGFYVQTKYGPE